MINIIILITILIMCNAYINTPKIKLHMSAVGILIHLESIHQKDVKTFSAGYIVMQIHLCISLSSPFCTMNESLNHSLKRFVNK